MSNSMIVKEAFEEFRNQMDKKVMSRLNLACENILYRAIRARLSQQDGHDYTGNLINSIVVVLYDEGEIANVLISGREGMIKRPIRGKMYARKKPFVFARDYSGRNYSRYKAEVPTNNGYADEDVENFLASHRPTFTQGYCITVAYTVEYAEWVEAQRQTTGYLQSLRFAGKQMRISFIPLKAS